MKSPITGKEMSVQKKESTLSFRKETFPVVYHYYVCTSSNEQFTSTALDEINVLQLYNQYRDKFKLPFPEDIRLIREKYGLSATKMAEILGFGVNSYRNYENGEVPSQSNSKLILFANDPKKFRDLVEISDAFDLAAKTKLLKKIDDLITDEKDNFSSFELEHYLLNGDLPDKFCGYRKPSMRRLTEMVVFFSEQLEPWKPQMNKLLFYTDFLAFKRTCFSISGAKYRATNMGPVLNNFNSIFEYMANKNEVDIKVQHFDNGGIGEQFKPYSDRKFNKAIFSQNEIEILKEVVDRFKGVSTSEIVQTSCKERAWIENESENKIICYEYAFDLSQI